MREKLCFNVFVIEKKDVVVGMKVGESVKRTLDRIAEETDRTISYVARELMIRGLALYHADGKLKDEVRTDTERHLAPVVATIGSPKVSEDAELRRQIQRGIDLAPVSEKKMPAKLQDKTNTQAKRRTR